MHLIQPIQPVRLALTIPEACSAIGISRSALYLLLADGTLPSIKIRKRRLVTIEALETLVRQLDNKEVAR